MHIQPVDHMSDEAYVTRAEGGYSTDVVASNDALDDVFGSAPSSPTLEPQHESRESHHPSEMIRLRREHETAGYREGLTVAKENSLQAGFDEGFGLGASIGIKVGEILGLLEGIAGAVKGLETDEAERVRQLEQEAQNELDVREVFGVEYWHGDGNWKFDVSDREEGETVFSDVAEAHPLVRKWAKVVDEQVEIWGLDRTVLDDETGERVNVLADEPIVPSNAVPAVKKPLDW